MKITKIEVYQVALPMAGSPYRVSGGRAYGELVSTIVRIITETGLDGLGESVPFGSTYLPAFANGIPPGIAEVAPALLGLDPRKIASINQVMHRSLMGHPYVKSAIDIACWDILGKSVELPIYDLLGGRLVDTLPFRIGVIIDDNESAVEKIKKLRRQGFFLFNLKVGDDARADVTRIRSVIDILGPEETLVIDANRGWMVHDALYVMRSIQSDCPVFFEQPCATYEECVAVRRSTDHAIILDEVVEDMDTLLRLHRDKAAEGITLKIARFGGLTHARFIRDLCTNLRIPMHIQDSSANGIGTAAVAHLAHSTPKEVLLGAWGYNADFDIETTIGAPILKDGCLVASDAPGLGVELRFDVVGDPIAVYA